MICITYIFIMKKLALTWPFQRYCSHAVTSPWSGASVEWIKLLLSQYMINYAINGRDSKSKQSSQNKIILSKFSRGSFILKVSQSFRLLLAHFSCFNLVKNVRVKTVTVGRTKRKVRHECLLNYNFTHGW